MKRFITTLLTLFVISSVSALAQDKPHNFEAGLGINIYGLGADGGPSKDFGPGFHFEYRYNYSERVDVGGHLYYKYGKGTSAFTGIDSPTWGFVDNHIGLKGVADFNMRPGKSVRPYIGVGVGGAVLVTTRTTGDYDGKLGRNSRLLDPLCRLFLELGTNLCRYLFSINPICHCFCPPL